MKLKQRPVTIVAIAAALLCLAISGTVVWRVERALNHSKGDLARRESLGVEIRTFGPQPNPGFEGTESVGTFCFILLPLHCFGRSVFSFC